MHITGGNICQNTIPLPHNDDMQTLWSVNGRAIPSAPDHILTDTNNHTSGKDKHIDTSTQQDASTVETPTRRAQFSASSLPSPGHVLLPLTRRMTRVPSPSSSGVGGSGRFGGWLGGFRAAGSPGSRSELCHWALGGGAGSRGETGRSGLCHRALGRGAGQREGTPAPSSATGHWGEG